MAQITINLPNLVITSSAVDTSTAATGATAWDVSDATSIAIWANGATTAPGFQVQAALSSFSTATFFPVAYPSSGATLVYVTSAQVTTIPVISFQQIRMGASNVTSTSATFVANKRIFV